MQLFIRHKIEIQFPGERGQLLSRPLPTGKADPSQHSVTRCIEINLLSISWMTHNKTVEFHTRVLAHEIECKAF